MEEERMSSMVENPTVNVNVNPGMQVVAKTVNINKHMFTWLFAWFLGIFGVDRFVRGQVGLGIVKLLFGWLTIGIWPLVDWIIAIVKSYSTYSDTEELTFINGKYSR